MKRLLITAVLAVSLTGCATNDYVTYAKAQAAVETAKHNADAAKYRAMADIASSGTEASKVAAVMAMAMGGNAQQSNTGMQAPQASQALQWAQVLVPGLTQVAGIAANMRVGIVQSDNSARVAVSTNDAFTNISGKIQASNTNTTTTTNNTTLSGTGTLGSGTYSTTDNHSVDSRVTNPAPVVINPPVIVNTPIVQIVPVR